MPGSYISKYSSIGNSPTQGNINGLPAINSPPNGYVSNPVGIRNKSLPTYKVDPD